MNFNKKKGLLSEKALFNDFSYKGEKNLSLSKSKFSFVSIDIIILFYFFTLRAPDVFVQHSVLRLNSEDLCTWLCDEHFVNMLTYKYACLFVIMCPCDQYLNFLLTMKWTPS